MKRIEIFKTGRHRDMNGRIIDFSEKDLNDIAAVYDPAGIGKAPFVIGHPDKNGPVYGWAKGLFVKGGVLLAEPENVDIGFAESVRAGRWPNRSASFYLPDSPMNPKPGAYYLRHIGFLGAQPPAVKGLAPVEFAGEFEGTIDFAASFPTGANEIENIVLQAVAYQEEMKDIGIMVTTTEAVSFVTRRRNI